MNPRHAAVSSVAVALLFGAAAGCKDESKSSNDREPNDTDPTTGEDAAWTILVYMLGDNNLEEAAISDLAEMTEAGQNKAVNIIVELDRARGYTDVWDNWTSTKRLRVVKDDVVELDDLGEKNLGDPAALADFIDWGVNTFPSDRTALILWDHGAGWIGYGSDDSADEDLLTYAELKEGISGGLSQAEIDKFDIIGFDACLMAAYETAFTVQKYADFLIASEQLEPGHGWDYTSLSAIIDDPTMDASALGREILKGYAAQAAKEGTDKDITLSLIDLSKLGNVTDALSALVDSLVANLPEDAALLARSVLSTLEFGANEDQSQAFNLFDLGNFADNLAAASDTYSDDAAAIRTALDAAVPDLVRGDVTEDACGLSIYFPLNPNYYWKAYDEAAADVSWRDVIDAFYKAGDDIPEGRTPVFVNPDKIADATWDDASASLLLGGQLQEGTFDGVTDTVLEFGVVLSDTEFVFLGDLPAEMDGSGYVSGSWTTSVFLIEQGSHYEYCYVSWTEEGDYLIAAVPMQYLPSGESDGVEATWVVIFDATSGDMLEADLYATAANGQVAVLTPEAGSALVPLAVYTDDQGTTFSWENIAETPFDAMESIALTSEPLGTGTTVITALIATDFAGNGDAVFYAGVL